MTEIERDNGRSRTDRAPLKREAPLPSDGPITPQRKPTTPRSSKVEGLFRNNHLDFTASGFAGGPQRRKGYRLAMWSLLASVIDALILISLSCLAMFVFSLVVRTPVGSVLKFLTQSQHAILLFVEVFFVFGWLYMISVRGILGYSVGEWACELRLGQPQERLSSKYILRVTARATLILLTGIVTLPLVSLVIGKDVAGVLSGLRLFSLK